MSIEGRPAKELTLKDKLRSYNQQSLAEQKNLLINPVCKGEGMVELLVKRRTRGLGEMLFPTYELYHAATGKLLLGGKKMSKIIGKYVFSVDSNNVAEKGNGYVGTLTSNLFGSFYNLYDYVGSSGVSDKNLGRNILAINYDFGLFKKKRVRKFLAVIPKDKFYSTATPQPTANEVTSGELHDKKDDEVITFTSKDPVWSRKNHSYVLDFKGKVAKASVKNFVLVEKGSNKECVIFGKIDDNLYSLTVMSPFSLFQAFALAISSVAFKIGCE
eukprot:TRINITY_DN7157_c0_g1_i1.p1 TRINITY_DN7157_c0_g1~~TRINITY_DN7157_c0_g1_i1.p1  ORF type:complete len:272 (-),score=57.58 TRINITY_DN7157_c0_g1_i1:121-936(-)